MLNYNDLYELLRKEKYAEVLQVLPKNFIQEISDYLREKRSQSAQGDNLLDDNVIKIKKQYENSIAIFKELMRLRKKKLLNLVFVATETGMMKRDYENMLTLEKDMFDKLVKTLEDSDKELAKNLTGERETKKQENKMILFNQEVEQFVDMAGNPIGPFLSGQLANLDTQTAEILVSSGKARLVDEE